MTSRVRRSPKEGEVERVSQKDKEYSRIGGLNGEAKETRVKETMRRDN